MGGCSTFGVSQQNSVICRMGWDDTCFPPPSSSHLFRRTDFDEHFSTQDIRVITLTNILIVKYQEKNHVQALSNMPLLIECLAQPAQLFLLPFFSRKSTCLTICLLILKYQLFKNWSPANSLYITRNSYKFSLATKLSQECQRNLMKHAIEE